MKIKTLPAIIIFIAFLFLYSFIDTYILVEKEKTITTNVIDGDTIVINGGERVRLLGIDTPEKGEFYYKEAKARLEQLIENNEISIEKEGDNKDKYDRLLRYIFLNETNINMEMVEEGYAICYFYGKSRYQSLCRSLEQNAMQNKLGRWQNNKSE